MTDTSGYLQEVTYQDIHLIQSYIDKAQYEESNHNVLNMMIWKDLFQLQQWHDKDIMILFCTYKDKTFAYMPLCEEIFFEKGIHKIFEIFESIQKPVCLNCYTEKAKEKVEQIYPEHEFESYSDIEDYIYETEKLKTFSGKKLQKKRNHLNAFYKENKEYRYESLTKENIDECHKFYESWMEDLEDEFLFYEKKGIESVWKYFDLFDIKGGIIYIQNEVKAFIIATRLSDRMIQINVEKADDQIRGIYQAIIKEFLEHEYPDVTLVNREDDMGKENLRKAKEAYYPIYKIKKYKTKGGLSW